MTFIDGPERVDTLTRPITVDVYEADNLTFVRTLTTDLSGSREWTDELPTGTGVGSASLSVPLYVPNDDLDEMIANPDCSALTRGRVLRFRLDGSDRFSAVVRPRRQTSVSTAGPSAQTRTVRCAGLLSEWDRAVLPPAPGARFFYGGDTRHFGWMSQEADVTSLDTPDVLREVFASGKEHPDPWIDGFGAVFDASEHRYFIFDQVVEDPLSLSCHMGFGDQGQVWLNSVPMGQGALPPDSSWAKTRRGGAKLPAGTHRWGFDIQGLPSAPEPRFCATAFEINDATTGQMNGDTILWRTGYITGTTLWPGWKASATAQGPTAKQIIRSVLEQVQEEQGKLLDWSIDGADDTVDANGNELDRIPHLPVQVGVKLASGFLSALASSWCDLGTAVAGKTLKVYRWRERGTFHTNPASPPKFSDALFSPVNGRLANIISLTHEERIQ